MLSQAVREIREGLYEADLGGNLVKKRIARPGQGKSGGFRTIVATRDGERCFFVYGFAKNDQDNMDDEDVEVPRFWPRRYWTCPRWPWREPNERGS